MTYFVDGFNSSRLRKQLNLQEHETYAEARSHAMYLLTRSHDLYAGGGRYEEDGRVRSDLKRERESEPPRRMTDAERRKDRKNKFVPRHKQPRVDDRDAVRDKLSAGPRCFNCQGVGHLSRDCPEQKGHPKRVAFAADKPKWTPRPKDDRNKDEKGKGEKDPWNRNRERKN